MYKTFVKIVTAGMLTLVLAVGVFGFVTPQTAHATSTTALESQNVEELKATLIALIRQLLAVLEQQFVAAGGSLEDLSSGDEHGDESLDDNEDTDEDLNDDHGNDDNEDETEDEESDNDEDDH